MSPFFFLSRLFLETCYLREITVRTYSPKSRTMRTHLGFVKKQGQCEQPCNWGSLGWRAVGTLEDISGAHTKRFRHGYMIRMMLADMTRGDHSENIKSSGTKARDKICGAVWAPNLWGQWVVQIGALEEGMGYLSCFLERDDSAQSSTYFYLFRSSEGALLVAFCAVFWGSVLRCMALLGLLWATHELVIHFRNQEAKLPLTQWAAYGDYQYQVDSKAWDPSKCVFHWEFRHTSSSLHALISPFTALKGEPTLVLKSSTSFLELEVAQ